MNGKISKESVYSIFCNPPAIETERLVLRAISARDKFDMFEYTCDSEVTRYLTWKPHPNVQFTKRYIDGVLRSYRNGTFHDFAIELKCNGKMIGTCGFTSFDYENGACEVGYVLNPRYRGYSLMPEAVRAVMDIAFVTLGAERVFARFIEGNDASRRVMEKCGMVYMGCEKNSMLHNGRPVDVGTCQITKEEYKKLFQKI